MCGFIHHKIGVFGDTEKHFFGASLVGALFCFGEEIMIFKKLFSFIVAITTVLSISSCGTVNYLPDTTESNAYITEPIIETVSNITEEIKTETEFIKEEKPFILNKKTKKFHNEDCRYVGFMNEENKIFVTSTPEKLQSQSYSPCAFCQQTN